MARDSEADDAVGAQPMQGRGYSTPNPDPTVLTTAALYREVKSLQELVELRIAGVTARLTQEQETIHERLNKVQHEREQRFEIVDRMLRDAIEARDRLDREKDRRVQQRFDLQEQQRIEQKNDTKAAVDAALTAQKEAVKEQTTASSLATAKSETATLKQLDQLAQTFTTAIADLRRSIDEVKERQADDTRILRASITDVASTANAFGQQRRGGMDQRAIIGWAVAAVVGLVAIAGFIIDLAKP